MMRRDLPQNGPQGDIHPQHLHQMELDQQRIQEARLMDQRQQQAAQGQGQSMARRELGQQPPPQFQQQQQFNQQQVNQGPPPPNMNQNQGPPPPQQGQPKVQQGNQGQAPPPQGRFVPQRPPQAQNNAQNANNGQPPVHVTVVHEPAKIIINTGTASDGTPTIHITQDTKSETQSNATQPESTPGRGRRHPLDQSQAVINPNDLRPKSRNKNKKKTTHSFKSMELSSEEDEESRAAEDDEERSVPTTTEAPQTVEVVAPKSSTNKRTCLAGHCNRDSSSNKPVKKHICRGKQCALEIEPNTKERRHIRPAIDDNRSAEVATTEAPQSEQAKSITVVHESHGYGSTASNAAICGLQRVQQVNSCLQDFPWSERFVQPLGCPASNRKWRCFCGFFED